MNTTANEGGPDVEYLVLQARAAHVYLDAIEQLSSAERKAHNRAQAEAVSNELARFLAEVHCDEAIRSRIEGLERELRRRLDATPS